MADNSTDRCFEVQLANSFETHAPRNQKVKAEGYAQFSYDKVNSKLGMNPE